MDSFDSSRCEKKHPLVGTTIGQYRVIDVIASGGMGLVLKACQLMTERMVALKLLPPELVKDELNVKRLQREARALAQLNHPNIITTFDFCFAPDGQPFLVIELLEGENLGRLLKREMLLPVDRAVPIFRQAADGMRFAHAKGILHRDIKPQNIMICNEPALDHVKVLDFGIAQLGEDLQRLTRAGEVVGSPTYMSPEQCLGEPVGECSDIYSLGVVMFEVLTGEPPYRGTSVTETMSKKVKEPVPRFSDIVSGRVFPELLESVVLTCLARNPESRIASMADLKEQLMIVERMYKQGDTAHRAHRSLRRTQSGPLRLRGEKITGDSQESQTINGVGFLSAVDKGLNILSSRRRRQSAQLNNFLDELSASFQVLKRDQEHADVEEVTSFLDEISQGLRKLDKSKLDDDYGAISAFLKEMCTGIGELKDYDILNKSRTIHQVSSFLDVIETEMTQQVPKLEASQSSISWQQPPEPQPFAEATFVPDRGASSKADGQSQQSAQAHGQSSAEAQSSGNVPPSAGAPSIDIDATPRLGSEVLAPRRVNRRKASEMFTDFDEISAELSFLQSESGINLISEPETAKPAGIRGTETGSSHLLSGLDDSGKILAGNEMQKAIAPSIRPEAAAEAAVPSSSAESSTEAAVSSGRTDPSAGAGGLAVPPPPPPGNKRPSETMAKMKALPPPPLPLAHKKTGAYERVHVFSEEEKAAIARSYAKPPPPPGKSDPTTKRSFAPPPLPAAHKRAAPPEPDIARGAPPPPPPGQKRADGLKPGAPPPPPGRRSPGQPQTIPPGLKDPMIVRDEGAVTSGSGEQSSGSVEQVGAGASSDSAHSAGSAGLKDSANLMPESSDVFTTETAPKAGPEDVSKEWKTDADEDSSSMPEGAESPEDEADESPRAKSFVSGHAMFAPSPVSRGEQETDEGSRVDYDEEDTEYSEPEISDLYAPGGGQREEEPDYELGSISAEEMERAREQYQKHLQESTSNLFDVLEDDFEDFDVDSIDPSLSAEVDTITGDPQTVEITGEVDMIADLDREMEQLEKEEFSAFPQRPAAPPELFAPTEHEVLDFLEEIDQGLEHIAKREPPVFLPGVAQEFSPSLPPQLMPTPAPPSLDLAGNPVNFVVNDPEFLKDLDQGIGQLENRRKLEDGLMEWEAPQAVEDQLGPWKGMGEAPKAPWHNRPKTKVWDEITKPKEPPPPPLVQEVVEEEDDEFADKPEPFQLSSWIFGNKKLVLIAIVLVAIAIGSTIVAISVVNSDSGDVPAEGAAPPSEPVAPPPPPPQTPQAGDAPPISPPPVAAPSVARPKVTSSPPAAERSTPKKTPRKRAQRNRTNDDDTASGAPPNQPPRRRAYQTTQYADQNYDESDAGGNMP